MHPFFSGRYLHRLLYTEMFAENSETRDIDNWTAFNKLILYLKKYILKYI